MGRREARLRGGGMGRSVQSQARGRRNDRENYKGTTMYSAIELLMMSFAHGYCRYVSTQPGTLFRLLFRKHSTPITSWPNITEFQVQAKPPPPPNHTLRSQQLLFLDVLLSSLWHLSASLFHFRGTVQGAALPDSDLVRLSVSSVTGHATLSLAGVDPPLPSHEIGNKHALQPRDSRRSGGVIVRGRGEVRFDSKVEVQDWKNGVWQLFSETNGTRIQLTREELSTYLL